MQPSKSRSTSWRHGLFSVQALGGMIGPAVFVLPNGQQISPFHIAPWWNDPAIQAEGGLLAGLRGEWPCVPFGYPMPIENFPQDWQSVMSKDDTVADVHGYSSNVDWVFDETDDGSISLHIDYPQEHAIRRLERVIRPDPETAALDFSLTIHARRETTEPLALHGVFALPTKVGAARLEPGAFRIGRTHPGRVYHDAPLFDADRTFENLTDVPGSDGQSVDASALPFSASAEDLLQLDDIDGTFSLACKDQGYRLRFTWDNETLPSVLLWYSNFGRSESPWDGRHLCIGIEPICSSFGLSPKVSQKNNTISASGTSTAVVLKPGHPLVINYRIEVEEI